MTKTNLLPWLPLLDEWDELDIARVMDRPFSPLLNRQSVIREMEEVPAAFVTTLDKLKGPRYTLPVDPLD